MNQPNPIRILIVDDDPLILFMLEKIIQRQPDLNVMGTAHNGNEALAFLHDSQPDVILLDIEMPHMNGIECLQIIRRRYPAITVILLTSFAEEHYVIEGLANGAQSYLLKTMSFANLDQYIRDAFNGSFSMPTQIATKLAAFLQQKKDVHEKSLNPLFFQTFHLTNSEQQIVTLLIKRLSNPEIATQLRIQTGTVRNHLVAIFAKLNVQNRKEAVALIETYLD